MAMNEINKKRKIIWQMQKLGMTVDAADLEEIEKADDIKHIDNFCQHIPSSMKQHLARIKHPVRIIVDVMPEEEMIRVGNCEIKDDNSTFTLIPTIRPKYKKILQICTPEGELWEDRYSYRTFLHFIETIGEEVVANLNLTTSSGILMSKDQPINSQISRQTTKNGWQVMTSIATAEKVNLVNEISEKLGLDYLARIASFPVED